MITKEFSITVNIESIYNDLMYNYNHEFGIRRTEGQAAFSAYLQGIEMVIGEELMGKVNEILKEQKSRQ